MSTASPSSSFLIPSSLYTTKTYHKTYRRSRRGGLSDNKAEVRRAERDEGRR
jgi:hypothetical protein